MIDKKTRREKTKELHNTTLSTLTLAALCQKVKEPAPSHLGKGQIWNPPSQIGSRRISPRPAKPPPGQATSFSGTRHPFNSSIFVNGFHLPWDNLERIPLFKPKMPKP